MEYSSFITEHTSEFVLVPVLASLFSQEYECVVPIYPWLTREGNNFSKELHGNEKFRVFGMYPRRPKFDLSNNKYIIKINHELIDTCKIASNQYIPMIAGCPLIRNFWDISKKPNCIWIKLTSSNEVHYEFEMDLTKEMNNISEDVLNEENLKNYVMDNSRPISLENFIDFLKNIKLEIYGGHRLFGPTYKPVYFLLK